MKKTIIFFIWICFAWSASAQNRITIRPEDSLVFAQEVNAMKNAKNEKNAVIHFQNALNIANFYFGFSLDSAENDTKIIFELLDATQWTTENHYKNKIKDLDPSNHSYSVWEYGTRTPMEYMVEWLARLALASNDQSIWIRLCERPTETHSPLAAELAASKVEGQ